MFTGIITHQGVVLNKTARSLSIKVNTELLEQLALGASIAVNGACLTVNKILPGRAFQADVMPETFKKTMLDELTAGSRVNLELPLSANGRFGGHIVQGHIDATAVLQSIKRVGNSRIFDFTASKKVLGYMVEKGSVAINGISLTPISVNDKKFSVGIIPHTWEHTALKSAKIGDAVNLELDILAKYIYKFVNPLKNEK